MLNIYKLLVLLKNLYKLLSLLTSKFKMKNKFIYLTLVIVISLLTFSIASMATASAWTVNLIAPATSAIVSGATVTLNATISADANVKNCTFYAKSSGALTANSTWSSLATATNTSAGDLVFNTTFDSSILEDCNDYIFNATCRNDTVTVTNASSTGVTIENTIPQAASSLSPTDKSTDTDGSILFSGTVTGVNTTSCVLYFGVESYAMAHSGNTCTYTLSNIPEQTYSFWITASDETNTTNSATYTSTIDITKSAGKAALIAQREGAKVTGPHTLTFTNNLQDIFKENSTLFIIIGVAVGIFVIISLSKKRKIYYRG